MATGTVNRSMFGFTESQADLDAVTAWRDAAIADGWDHEPTYGHHEGEDRACRLRREGFTAQILTRSPTNTPRNWLAETQVSLWGPDGMAIKPPDIYDWSKIRAGVETCNYCGANPVKTQRIGFAGRACATCAPIEWKKLPRNWAD